MQALQVFWQGINSEGQPCEGILIEAGGLEQIRQQLHHQGFFSTANQYRWASPTTKTFKSSLAGWDDGPMEAACRLRAAPQRLLTLPNSFSKWSNQQVSAAQCTSASWIRKLATRLLSDRTRLSRFVHSIAGGCWKFGSTANYFEGSPTTLRPAGAGMTRALAVASVSVDHSRIRVSYFSGNNHFAGSLIS